MRFTHARSTTTLDYAGDQLALTGTSFVPKAKLTGPDHVYCQPDRLISFTVYPNPMTGSWAPLYLGPRSTEFSGQTRHDFGHALFRTMHALSADVKDGNLFSILEHFMLMKG